MVLFFSCILLDYIFFYVYFVVMFFLNFLLPTLWFFKPFCVSFLLSPNLPVIVVNCDIRGRSQMSKFKRLSLLLPFMVSIFCYGSFLLIALCFQVILLDHHNLVDNNGNSVKEMKSVLSR